MSRDERFIQKAIDEVEYDNRMKSNLAAILVKAGAIISIARNRLNTNAYTRLHAYRDEHASVHAEVHAILQIRRKIDLRGCVMYVARRMFNGSTAMARPCPMCQKALQDHGIKRVFYTIDDDTYAVMNVRTLTDQLRASPSK
jgi:tRNA(Arg) A34 adenosine deaminase TadA